VAAISAIGTPKSFLLAISSARGDDRAVDRAFQLAAQWNAVLTILHVIDSTAHGRTGKKLFPDEILESISREFAEHPHSKGLRTDLQVVSGDPAEQILIKSKQMKPDMIVMGVGHHDSLEKRFLGSTIHRVIRAATVPVLSVRSRAFATYESILILTDFSPPSQRALATVMAFNLGRSGTVLHVCEAISTVMAEDKLEALKAELAGKLTDTVHKAMTASSIDTKMQESKFVTALEFGDPINVVEHDVADSQPQLVVVGTHGRTGFLRAVLGSVAENFLRTLPCDVLVVGSPDKTE
jgi:universal stress protein E